MMKIDSDPQKRVVVSGIPKMFLLTKRSTNKFAEEKSCRNNIQNTIDERMRISKINMRLRYSGSCCKVSIIKKINNTIPIPGKSQSANILTLSKKLNTKIAKMQNTNS